MFHVVAATTGLSTLINYSEIAFHTLQFVGSAYLVFLGISAFRGSSTFFISVDKASCTHWQIYRKGILVNILNPKMLFLFIALLPQFVTKTSVSPVMQIIVMGVMHAVIAFIVQTHVVVLSNFISNGIKSSGRVQKFLRWIMGGLLIGFGARLALLIHSKCIIT